jgi:hypothetical protein
VAGRSDPDRWAEALLAAGAHRDQAAPPLRQAWTTASALKARPLLAQVESLGRRARIEPAPAPSRPDGTAREDSPDTGLHRLSSP